MAATGTTSRQLPGGRPEVRRGRRGRATATSTSPPRTNAHDVLARLDRLVRCPRTPPGAWRGARACAGSDRASAGGSAGRAAAGGLPVDRPAVVGIDEREVAAARRPGRCPARPGTVSFSSTSRARSPSERSRQPLDVGARAPSSSSRPSAQRLRTRLPLVIRVEPVRVHLRLAQRLLEVALEPRRRRAATRRRASGGPGTPRSGRASRRAADAHERRPLVRIRRERRSRARTSALRFVSCVVVASSAAAAAARGSRRGTSSTREPEAAGVAADLVQRDEPVPAVERRVLDALRVHRRRRLLEADDERVVPALLEQQDPRAARSGRLGAPDRGAVLGRRRRPGVRARRRCGRRGSERARAAGPPRTGSCAASCAASAANVVCACSSFASRRDLVEARALARELLVEPRSAAPRRPGRRRAPSRRSGTRSRSSPRPASRAAPRPARGSSRPRRARRPPRAAARGSARGFASPSGWSTRRPSTSPSRTSSITFACVTSQTSGSSIRTPASSPTSKKRRCDAGAPVEVEELRPPERVAPERVLVVAAMWFGTMSSTTPEPGCGRRRARGTRPRRRAPRRRGVGSTTS